MDDEFKEILKHSLKIVAFETDISRPLKESVPETCLSLKVSGKCALDWLPSGLRWLYVYNSKRLTSFPDILPPSLRRLSVWECPFPTLPPLPAGLQVLHVTDCSNITSLPLLPETLEELRCHPLPITELPVLPKTLKVLGCSIHVLPAVLPDHLEKLKCYGQMIYVPLPVFQNTLTSIILDSIPLESLPSLPEGLRELMCTTCELRSLPERLPSGLQHLIVSNNHLTHLPCLPESLEYLICDRNKLVSLPPLPKSISILNINENRIQWLRSPLPTALYMFKCIKNRLYSIPDPLPSCLTVFHCEWNQLSYFPETLELTNVGRDAALRFAFDTLSKTAQLEFRAHSQYYAESHLNSDLRCENNPWPSRQFSEPIRMYIDRMLQFERWKSKERITARCAFIKEELMTVCWHTERLLRIMTAYPTNQWNHEIGFYGPLDFITADEIF
jgi:Leucine-rich repeat (LRR) protein